MEDVKNTQASEIISHILAYFQLNASDFSKKIGVSTSKIYDIKRGQIKNISSEMLEKILIAFPQINSNWLITGEGDMLNNGQQGGIVTSVNMHNSTNSGTINNGQQGGIVISADVWEVIQQQSASLAKKDSQIDRLIDLMERQSVKE